MLPDLIPSCYRICNQIRWRSSAGLWYHSVLRIRSLRSLLVIAVLFSIATAFADIIRVSPDGDDAGDGSSARPFRTAMRARDEIRSRKARGAKGKFEVVFAPGTYPVHHALNLTEKDSGENGMAVEWRAEKPGTAVFNGGFRVSGWHRVGKDDAFAHGQLPDAAFGKVWVADVGQAGEGALAPSSYGGTRSGREIVSDLYADGDPLQLAREPNDAFLMTGKVHDRSSFESAITDVARWAREPELMACGYWHWLYRDQTAHVDGVLTNGWIRMTEEVFDNPHYRTIVAERPYFLVNALCALDRPGEWFLHRQTGKLYLIPPKKRGKIVLSAMTEPFVTLTNVHDVAFSGLVFRYGRQHGVVATRTTRLRLEDCDISCLGGEGLLFDRMKEVRILGCRLENLGHGGVRISAGDRKTLESGDVLIADCDISFPDRHRRTYAPCVLLEGVGLTVDHCYLHDCRSSAIRFDGNDMILSHSLIERAVQESDDQGALDTYGYVSYQGNRIIGNVWRDIGKRNEIFRWGHSGVRLDDLISRVVVASNRFIRASAGGFGAVQINAGCQNLIENNLFVGCENARHAAISVSFCTDWFWKNGMNERKLISSKWGEDVFSEPYASRYPGIDRFWEWPKTRDSNIIRRNIVVGEGHCAVGCYWQQPDQVLDGLTGSNIVIRSTAELDRARALIGFALLPPMSDVGPRSRRFKRKSNKLKTEEDNL